MGNWETWTYSVIVCVLSCGILTQIVSESKRKEIMRLICGILLSISLFRPLTRIDFREFLNLSGESWDGAESFVMEGERIAAQAQEDSIRAACETYILNKASALGADVKAYVSLTDAGIPGFVELSGQVEPRIQQQLQTVLTMELGIPKENQKWIWNQESNSS